MRIFGGAMCNCCAAMCVYLEGLAGKDLDITWREARMGGLFVEWRRILRSSSKLA